ncbi:AAA family ATPase [Sphingopyxis sp.]|uniref:AAA family ATPase n=1 Tax=Sphingopyxis sp. TaxID=1908224 RepID=UPI002FC7C581
MFVMISGCSGGGKSTLLSELARRGYPVVEEPALRVVADERQGDGRALPWVDAAAFGQRALAMSIADHLASRGLTFFDRGVVDAGVAITAQGGKPPKDALTHYRYDLVFLAPPWPEIYEVNEDRRHSLEKALRDYERVRIAYLQAGYDPFVLPRETVTARADFILTKVPLIALDLEPSPPTLP